jgi:16S rRNA (guanine(966)-N(2))-methyltransferase RsmD
MNLLAGRLEGCRWLDLFSGSGVMACEALQRGAAEVVAVERDRRHVAVTRRNLEAVGGATVAGRWPPEREGEDQLRVIGAEVISWLRRPGNARPFDLIYADPPYREGLYGGVAAGVLEQGWLAPGGLLVWECASDALPELPPGWLCHDQRRYGSSTIQLLEPQLLEPQKPAGSAAQGAAAAVLVPGGHEEANQGHGDQTEHDAAEQGFDHGETP